MVTQVKKTRLWSDHGNPDQKRSFGVQATMQTTKFPHAVDILFFSQPSLAFDLVTRRDQAH